MRRARITRVAARASIAPGRPVSALGSDIIAHPAVAKVAAVAVRARLEWVRDAVGPSVRCVACSVEARLPRDFDIRIGLHDRVPFSPARVPRFKGLFWLGQSVSK